MLKAFSASTISLVLVFLGVLLSHVNVVENIWLHSFDDGTYSHAYLVVLITGYLYWENIKEGALTLRSEISTIAIAIFILAAYATHIATLAQLTNIARLATLILLLSSINLFFKPSIKSLFPAAFLIFLLPIWGVLVTPLQQLSVVAVTKLMSFTNIPVYVDGNFITIPAGVFEIAGGCSGLRYLLVSLAISCLYIYLYLRDTQSAIKFFAFAILGALLTNWIRIALLIIIGHETNMESPLMKDHNNFGWYLYIPYMMGLFYYGHKITSSLSAPKKIAPIQSSLSLAKVNIAIFCIAIVTFYYLKQVSYQSYYNAITCEESEPLATLPLPTLENTYKICQTTNDYIAIDYYFKPNNLDSKVDYFANELTPTGYSVIHEEQVGATKTYHINNGKNLTKINLQVSSHHDKSTPIHKLKLERLKNALVNRSGTKLQWQVTQCKSLGCMP
ncbi:exosortase [Thalassotalea sp. LPB0316]|uniref:exosortase n=1 Tax=Thalassotalea sp. LPB0316 TaxID=2769490 RepID=UPI0018691BA3|nr:exosortase [Thalassotalea sp. LPB0316]QOL26506.1 exosortase [Thalassotalea sp. LPB0316]